MKELLKEAKLALKVFRGWFYKLTLNQKDEVIYNYIEVEE